MDKISPYLWFDTQAKEAADFYVSCFPDSKITGFYTIHNTPSDDAQVVNFELAGHSFNAISAGPLFKFNPSISFIVNFDPSRDGNARGNLDDLWKRLSEGGDPLMPLGEYPFSKYYGWIADKYGLSWQLMLTDPAGEERPFIIPSLLFVGDMADKAEDAIRFYLSVFKDSKLGEIHRHGPGPGPDKEGSLLFADFMLEGQWFAASSSADPGHNFAFNEAVSLLVDSKTQEEIDYYWYRLSAVPESEQCGWLKDKFGVVWQISPGELDDMLKNGTREQTDRVTEVVLQMKKLDLRAIQEAYEGR